MCSETSTPRLSFSSDLGSQTDVMPLQDHRRDSSLLDVNCDFEFSTSSFSEQESSSADELFSHGIILPIQPRERLNFPEKQTKQEIRQVPSLCSLPPLPGFPENSRKEKQKETTVFGSDHLEHTKCQPTKSFWGTFKRSSSLNCENKKGLLWSLPLLSRSNSTGSVANQKRISLKDASKNSTSQKQPSISMTRSSSSSSSSNPYTTMQKPPLKKNYGGSYGNGVRIIPVINVPPPYIPKGTAKLFGFGSFLQHGKDRKSKK